MAAHFTSDVSITEIETNTDGGQKTVLTDTAVNSSTGEEVQTKIRYIHLNDRVYSVGGRRTDNPLQWYTIDTWSRASQDGPITDDISIYQIEEDRRTATDEGQRSAESTQTQANVYTLDRTSDDEQFPTSDVVDKNGARYGDADDLVNKGADVGNKMADDAISSPRTSEQRWRPSSSSAAMKDKQQLDVAMSQLRDSYEQQLAAYKSELENMQHDSEERERLARDVKLSLQTQLYEQLSINGKLADEVERVNKELASRDQLVTSLQSQIKAISDRANQLETSNKHLIQRIESNSVKVTQAVCQSFECLRPCCLMTPSQRVAGTISPPPANASRRLLNINLPTTAAAAAAGGAWTQVGPVLSRRVVRSQLNSAGPVRCLSAPVVTSGMEKEPMDMTSFQATDRAHQQRTHYSSVSECDLDNSNDVTADDNTNNGDVSGVLQTRRLALWSNRSAVVLPTTGSAVEHAYNTCTASSTCSVRFLEVADNGRYIRLINTSSKQTFELGNYIIQQNVNGKSVANFRFPPRVTLPKLGAVTVWSDGGKPAHLLPSPQSLEFVNRRLHKWLQQESCTTVLCRPTGQAVAWYTSVPMRAGATADVTQNTFVGESTNPNVTLRMISEATNNTNLYRTNTTDVDVISRDRMSPLTARTAQDSLEAGQSQSPYKSRDCDSESPYFSRRPETASAFGHRESALIPGLPLAGAPAQRLGSASLRRFRPVSATLH